MLFLASAVTEEGPLVPVKALELPGVDSWILPVTSSILQTWIIGIVIIIVVRLATAKMSLVPGKLQNFVEAIIEGMHNFISDFLEPKVVKWVFPFIATFFIFILVSNYSGLLPGIGSIGFGHPAEHSVLPFAVEHVDVPIFRPPTADANMTIAMASIFFVMCWIWAVRFNGVKGLYQHIFGVKGGMKGWYIVLPLTVIFLLIGCLEMISICIRPVALAMRLFGNIYGGESVLTSMLHMGWFGIAAIPFYFLELLVGTIQALVFAILCVAFTVSLCSHMDDGEGAHH